MSLNGASATFATNGQQSLIDPCHFFCTWIILHDVKSRGGPRRLTASHVTEFLPTASAALLPRLG